MSTVATTVTTTVAQTSGESSGLLAVIGVAVPTIIAIASIALVIVIELWRRPKLECLEVQDQLPKAADNWYHIWARNEEPRFFNRDAALRCKARVNFRDSKTGAQLCSQITAHWTARPEPSTLGNFDGSKIPDCQEMDLGFVKEQFDVARKYEGDSGFFAADPWKVYSPRDSPRAREVHVNAKECILQVQLESINSGRKTEAWYMLSNKGKASTDIEITKLDTPLSSSRRLQRMERRVPNARREN